MAPLSFSKISSKLLSASSSHLFTSAASYASKPKSPFAWRGFFQDKKNQSTDNKSKDKSKTGRPPKKCCIKPPSKCPDPDLSYLDGQPFKTCGSAYVVQKDLTSTYERPVSEEDLEIQKIEADPTFKKAIGNDPMPPFRSVEQRLIDLTERKLHPYYKIHMFSPKPKHKTDDAIFQQFYRSRSGSATLEQVPDQIKLKKEVLEKKNILMDFKQVQLPAQLLAQIIEMEKQRKTALEKKKKEAAEKSKEAEKKNKDKHSEEAKPEKIEAKQIAAK